MDWQMAARKAAQTGVRSAHQWVELMVDPWVGWMAVRKAVRSDWSAARSVVLWAVLMASLMAVQMADLMVSLMAVLMVSLMADLMVCQ